jgi:hypothetical protein
MKPAPSSPILTGTSRRRFLATTGGFAISTLGFSLGQNGSANISMRASEQIPLKEISAAVPQDDMLLDCLERQHAQLKEWNVDLAKTMCHVGAKVRIDPRSTIMSGNDAIKTFNETHYRKGYEIPKI